MKRKLNVTAALATTATVALLTGTAHAQMGGMGPQVCTTTQISPARQDCVMPTAAAPGGGSFPGSFLVPGTDTSFAVHGFIVLHTTHDFGPHLGDTGFSQFTLAVVGNGTGAVSSTRSSNGGTDMSVKATRPDIETRTPTAYGELKTYIEFDFNQTIATQLGGNNDLLRLRQAYGTLGPWLVGQSNSLYADPEAYADTATSNQDAGMMQTLEVRRPMVRYTWLVGNGLLIAGSVEEPTYVSGVGGPVSHATDTATTLTTVVLNGTSIYYNWPHFVGATEWDQPWGHLKFAGAGGLYDVREPNTSTGTSPSHENGAYAFELSGHLNTWGKDALRGGVWYNAGAADFSSEMIQGGEIYNDTTGAHKTTRAYAVYFNYEHFFTGQWRANVALGYVRLSGNPFTVACTSGASCPQAGLSKLVTNTEVNVIYSPVPQTDFTLEWQHAHRVVQSDAGGTANRIDLALKFYF